MITGENSQILHRPEQFKANLMPALLTNGKSVVFEQSGFVHQPVHIVSDPINAALWNQLSRSKLFAGVRMFFHSIKPGAAFFAEPMVCYYNSKLHCDAK
jgi:hypothetical protein